jgi:predicted phosphodiesterase
MTSDPTFSANSLRQVGLIGDVHGEDRLLTLALRFLAGRELDRVLCVGDVVDGPGDSARCCHLLREHGVETVRGNHDRWLLDGVMRELPDAVPAGALDLECRAFLGGLPRTRRYATPAGALLLCHGLGTNDMAVLGPDDEGYALEANRELQALLRLDTLAFVVCGHGHRQLVRRIEATTFINPGTLFRHHEPGFAVADFERGEVEFFDFEGSEVTPLRTVSLPGSIVPGLEPGD